MHGFAVGRAAKQFPRQLLFKASIASIEPYLYLDHGEIITKYPTLLPQTDSYVRHAEFQETSELSSALRSPETNLCYLFLRVRCNKLQPQNQRRNQGHIPGFHWQAGNIPR